MDSVELSVALLLLLLGLFLLLFATERSLFLGSSHCNFLEVNTERVLLGRKRLGVGKVGLL